MKNDSVQFKGDKKVPMKSLLVKPEKIFIEKNVSKFPDWVQTYHLTLMTIPFSAGLIIFGYLAASNIHWLWLSSLMLAAQWFTDCFDGAIGRYKNTGLIKWGYYMDHSLDYIFICSFLIGYSFLFETTAKQLTYLFIPLFGAFMVSSFLAFAATNEFKITFLGVGPTEARIFFIILNTSLIFWGTQWLEKILPVILLAAISILCLVVYRTQKYIWKIDMAEKAARTAENQN